ncbi:MULTISPECIES: aminotransferase class I/II-fold pyridoxal phosphate-dependent enzyme [unclassified Rhizobium]|uniref:8-amino-7-oxononanoate synthase family protein n=1 Tax=unclassified Rhizobium TaxID=2613769 RepID=UPI003806FF87
MEKKISARSEQNGKAIHRNTGSLINTADRHFEAAHYQGIMAIYAHPSQGRAVKLSYEDRMVVDFVRCSYLGLDNHPDIVGGAVEALRASGALHWSCARTRLNFAGLGDLEESLSDLFAARVITYTTVLAANMSALPLVASGHLTGGPKPIMVFDRLAHATLAYHKGTIAEETRVETIAHNDLEALERLCRQNAAVAFVCDGVYSMGGNAPISELRRLQEKYGLFLYIDDAHGVSLFGEHGEGFAKSQIGELGDRTIIAASLGKGFGASGGMLMLGTAHQEVLFRRFAVAHAFSASLNTAAIGAGLASARLHRTSELPRLQRALQEKIALLDALMPTAQQGAPLPIRTVQFGDELIAIGAARSLFQQGFYTSAIFFPTVSKGHAGLRICVTATHTDDQIKSLCLAIAKIKDEIVSAFE